MVTKSKSGNFYGKRPDRWQMASSLIQNPQRLQDREQQHARHFLSGRTSAGGTDAECVFTRQGGMKKDRRAACHAGAEALQHILDLSRRENSAMPGMYPFVQGFPSAATSRQLFNSPPFHDYGMQTSMYVPETWPSRQLIPNLQLDQFSQGPHRQNFPHQRPQ